jgi:hypothetical protein
MGFGNAGDSSKRTDAEHRACCRSARISHAYAYQVVKAGDLPVIRLGAKRVRVPRSRCVGWSASRTDRGGGPVLAAGRPAHRPRSPQ